LYTQFKEKSFIAGLGTNSNTLCEKVFCYSGGTELRHYSYNRKHGTSRIRGAPLSEGKNLLQYKIWRMLINIGFSKTYDDSFNPQSAFAAILTSGKRWRLPFILVLKKNPITFEDQKHLIITRKI
jgi:arsenate reductase